MSKGQDCDYDNWNIAALNDFCNWNISFDSTTVQIFIIEIYIILMYILI
jgi:hypothetical protein